MMGPDPGGGYPPKQDSVETALYKEDAHVDVNDEPGNRRQGTHAMQEHYDRQNPVEAARHEFRKPHHNARNEQQKTTIEHDPVKLLLPGVELTCRSGLSIIVGDVGLHRLAPLQVV